MSPHEKRKQAQSALNMLDLLIIEYMRSKPLAERERINKLVNEIIIIKGE